MPSAEFTAMALTAPALQFHRQILKPIVRKNVFKISMLRGQKIAKSLENAPRVNSAPASIDRPLAGADGKVYFVPQAQIAQRSQATGAPHVFLELSGGVVRLQVWFNFVRFPSLPSGSEALPVDNYSVSLVPERGEAIVFERCEDLPRGDQGEEVLSRLYCETPVDPSTVVPMLETLGSRFRIEGDVHYTTQDAGGTAGTAQITGPLLFLPPTGLLGAFARQLPSVTVSPPVKLSRLAETTRVVRDHRISAAATVKDARARVKPGVAATEIIGTGLIKPATPEATWTSHTVRLGLGAADHSGIAACFPRDVMNNKSIYAQVTSGFGSDPWSEWADLGSGQFMDSPVPDQFYVLPDEYRIAFDAETKQPAMMVLLVPPKRTEGEESASSFGADYKLRTRFSVVPWIDPARRERLRTDIARHTRVAYPELVMGGIHDASCELSSVFHELGSTIVGAEGAVSVDGLGFDLVLDCTSEFYNTLTHLLMTEGVGAQVKANLISDAEHPQSATLPVNLRLDRPATDVLSATLLPAENLAEPSPEAPPPAVDGDPPELPVPQLGGASILRVSNPLPYSVTVARTVASLLEIDGNLPSPIGAVHATAEPSTFTLPPATEAPSTIDIVLTPDPSKEPRVFGSAGVSFEGVDIEIDPQQILAKAYDTGTTGSISSTVEVRSYQLEHPESLPPELLGIFGLEVAVRRSAEARPITVFLTTDQPKLEVQLAFTLADIVAGMRPEQPSYEWRRRNMSGTGNGAWSEWASISGRQLFVSPTGI